MGPMLWICRCSGMAQRLSGKVPSVLRVTVTVFRVLSLVCIGGFKGKCWRGVAAPHTYGTEVNDVCCVEVVEEGRENQLLLSESS